MYLLDFPGCCTASVLTGFGGTRTGQYGRLDKYTDETLYQAIEQELAIAHMKNHALVFATTNSQQKQAERVLRKIGFRKVGTSAKKQHEEFTLSGWVYKLNLEKEVKPLAIPPNPFVKKVQPAKEERQVPLPGTINWLTEAI